MKKIALPIAAMASLLAPAALAQSGTRAADDGAQTSDDIVVTARRREERLQDVPIAVSAVDAAALNSRGLDNVTQVSQIAPNIQFTPGQGGNSGGIAPFIRGVGENDFIITSDPAVGVYIDGVYVARTFGAMTELLGIDRIEVLRGPQGTLFGKNTVGGAINIVSSVPGQEQRVETDLRYGSFNTVRARAYAETPLSDSWSLGVAALGEFGEGWQKIPSGDNLGNRNVVGGKLALHYRGATIDALLQADGLRRRQHSAPHSMVAFTPTFLSGLQSAFIAPCCTVPGDIDRTDSTAALNKDETDAFNSSLTLTADVGPATLKSITAYRHVDALFGRDGDASSTVNYAGDIHDEQARQISQELQLSLDLGGRGALLLGAFAYREKTRDNTRLVVADGLYPRLIAAGFDPALATALDFNIDFRNRQRTDNLALFANGNYEILDNLSLELGARYTWEKKRFTQSAMRIYANQPLLAGTPSYTLEKSWDAFTPRASLSYKVRPNLLTYASFSKGFRSGGFNGRPTSLEEIGSYDPEHLTAYEAGIKAGFGRIATINLAVFRNAYRDQQILVSTVSPTSGLLVVRNENAGRSRIQGIELEGNFRVSRHFTLTSALGLLDAKYLSYMSVINGVPTDVSNRSLKQAPDITANASAVYQTALSEGLDGLIRVDVAYKSAVFVDAENTALLRQPDHAIVNASAELRLSDRGLSLRAGVDNLTNRRIITAGYDASTSFGFTEAYYSPPRRYSLTLAWRR
ncbi:TonB-dependent receptor [Sphingomonas bisphenolicum]|uniref:TonB-dependent receptor n=1 Tax=Sphingomonas bisphenolicum TaxID=296544 RepID=A0ABN5WI28_9SPHN|nr:TonB-dependent receptor [Sphingomonas bisphenolicum]BBF71888.1 TonB-dependent receptor [Sphingomonas bisphenolicum]